MITLMEIKRYTYNSGLKLECEAGVIPDLATLCFSLFGFALVYFCLSLDLTTLCFAFLSLFCLSPFRLSLDLPSLCLALVCLA
jgi:hypothetical protein